MQILSRRPNWEQQLRDSGAEEQLLAGHPDRFPLVEVQKITNGFLEWTSTSSRRQVVAPLTEDCDVLLASEVKKVKDEAGVHEAGILACMHAFTYPQARGQLEKIRPDPQKLGEHFKTKLVLYLQCLILANQANHEGACTDAEAAAAQELFNVVLGRGTTFPSIWRLLHGVGHTTCDRLLPLDLVRRVLSRNFFRDNLMSELDLLQRSRNWLAAHKMVHGLRRVVGLPRARELLHEFFPDFLTWSAWRPDLNRLRLWKRLSVMHQREKLFPVLDLEGPDMTLQRQGTLGMSTPGIFEDSPAAMNDRSIVDRVLSLLDRSILQGQGAVDLFICVCVDCDGLTPQALEQMDAVLDLGNPSAAEKLLEYLRGVSAADATVHNRMIVFTNALPIFQSSPRLQRVFGLDLERLGPMTLSAGQKHYCRLLQGKRPSERFGLSVRALGYALLDSTWLHDYWRSAYIDMLKQMPLETEIKSIYHALEVAHGAARQDYTDLLALKLGGSQRRSRPIQTGSLMSALEDPIWHRDLDIDRASLRTKLRSMGAASKGLSTLCLKQALKEHDNFVRELNGILVESTDQVCVNLAYFLGSRMTTPQKVHEDWKSLLLQMMRERPPGLLERCGQHLLLQSWLSWVESLHDLYGDHHLDPEGGLGFTGEKFMHWSQHKMGVGRSLSTSTMATVSSVSTGRTGRMSFVSEYADAMRQ